MTITSERAARSWWRDWVRRHRAAVVIAAAVVVATGIAIAAGNRPTYSDALDPENPTPDGAQAVAQVLAREGVDVDIVRDAEALHDARIDSTTTVVVTSVGALGQSTADRLLRDVGDQRLVLVDPPVGSLALFGLPDGTRVREGASARGNCADRRFEELTVRVDSATAFSAYGGGCFRTEQGALLAQQADRPITILGAGRLLANDQVTRADNAAVALRLLGAEDRLVWYVPDVSDLLASDSTGLGSVLPDWLGPALWLLVPTGLALVLWRGRRLGPLVTEPLPVAVTAIESTQSRGRLYRKAADRAHAAGILRQAARARIAEHLRLPHAAAGDPHVVVRDIAGAIGVDPQRVHALLSPDAPAPRTDKELTQLATELGELDREVRRT
jgi:hypothetical protein